MNKPKIAILISGSGTNMAGLLYASRLPDAPYEVVLVASNVEDAHGLKIAKAEGVAVFALSHQGMERSAHDAAMDKAIRKSGADYIALAGYMRVIGEDFAASWQGRMINIHPSLLPKYKGLETHARAIEAGDRFGGCSVHIVTPELDGGPVLGQVPVAILPDDSADSLSRRVLLAEYQLYPRMLGEYVSRGNRADWLVQKVGTLALALPETEAKDSHGNPAWKSGGKSGKFFAHFSDKYHGSDHIGVLVKTSGQDELLSLCEQDPETYFKPAYYGASGWVGLVLNRPDLDWDHIAFWLDRSWRMVAPKRLTRLHNSERDAADEA